MEAAEEEDEEEGEVVLPLRLPMLAHGASVIGFSLGYGVVWRR